MNKQKNICCLVVVCMAFLFSVSLTATAHGEKSQNPHKHNLKSASELGYPPFALVLPDGSADGFSVELLKEVGSAVDLNVDFKTAPWHEIKQELVEGRIDVLPLVAYSPERDKLYDFSVPYFRMHGEIFVRRGEEAIHDLFDLRDKKILVMRDDIAHEYMIQRDLGDNLILTDTIEEALKMLAAGQHDAVVASELVGLQLIKKLGLTNVTGEHSSREEVLSHAPYKLLPGFEQKLSFAVREGDKELLAHLNEGLALVIADGTFGRLQEKWLTPILPASSVSAKLIIKYTIYLLGPILLLMVLAGLWYLKKEVAIKTRDFQESEGRFRELFDNMSNGVAVYEVVDGGEDFLFKDINRAGMKLSSVNRSEIVGNSVLDVFPGIREMGLLDVFRRVWKSGIPEFYPSAKYKDDRWEYWVENHVYKLPSGELVAIYDDVTERKKAEDKLFKSQDEWRKTFDAMSDIITIQDKDMKVIRANKAARDFFGVEPGGLTGIHCYEIFRGEDQPCAMCPELETLADCGVHSGTIKHDKLGKTFYVSSAPIFERDGEIKYIVHVAKDITEQKRLEEELFQSHKMEAVGTLAGGIAHDFNNILASIIGYSELSLLEVTENSPIKDNIDQIYIAGKRAKDLVKQILSFSRKDKQELQIFSPALIVKEALKLMRASMPSSISIKEEIDPGCGKIKADPTNFHQIIVNLFTNALHAIENEKGEIFIKLSQERLTSTDIAGQVSVEPGEFIVLTVRDTGCGIDEKQIDRIFEPYFTTKAAGKGTGMGLAVVHGIVKSYDGMIKVESELGKGSTFNLYFPASQSSIGPKVEKDWRSLESMPKGSERIMVVDDEEAILMMEKTILENLGYQVTPVSNSRDAVEMFRMNPEGFDLVITDQTMPIMTGVDLCEEISALRPDIPTILCTGYSSTIDEKKAMQAGVKKFLLKPVDLSELATSVRDVLDEGRE